jgi:membrane fusion protein, multidrug efflux system
VQLELDRQEMLVVRQASSRQLLEQAQANRDQADAAVNGAHAAIDSAAANVDVLKGQEQQAISTLNELKTALAKAERDLSFTVIRAPLDGVIGNRAASRLASRWPVCT